MKSIRGLLHTTSVQSAHEQQTSFSTTSLAGHKRSCSNNEVIAHRPNSIKSSTTVQFQRAISLPSAPLRLCASRIVDLQARDGISEYSQRQKIAATPFASRDPELDLGHPTYDLPRQLVDNFASLGIKQIYPWQKSCLKGPGLLTGEKNLVYCAPTGGGKSLVADRKLWICLLLQDAIELMIRSFNAEENSSTKGHQGPSRSSLRCSCPGESSLAPEHRPGLALSRRPPSR